jgi:hypothetical protein
MEDWLATFGTFESNLPAGLGAGNYYLPTNRKSLVVNYPPRSVPMILSEFFAVFFDRYPFSLLELSLARFWLSQWETWLAVNGELSLHA